MRPGLDAMNSALPSSHALFARGGEGLGVGGASTNTVQERERKFRLLLWQRFCRGTPHPQPLPTTRYARGGRGAIIVVTALSMKESYFGSSFSAAELMQ